MMTAEEKIAKLHEKMAARQRMKERRRKIAAGVTIAVLSVCFCVFLVGLLANAFGVSAGVPGRLAGLYDHAVGYVFAGAVAFALGVVIGVSAKKLGQNSPKSGAEDSGNMMRIPDDSIVLAVGGSGENNDPENNGQNTPSPDDRDGTDTDR